MFSAPSFRTKVVSGFYPRADEMRQRYDTFFSNPQLHDHTHQVFDYWHVPNHYLYMRAQAGRVIGEDIYQDFRAQLTTYARSLGFSNVSGSYLSLYVNGMHQNCHSDMRNGSVGWVYSITQQDRRFTGGETMVARADIFDQLEPRDHRGVTTYWECLPPDFNSLIMFDDRLAHYVSHVSGTMDPLEGRAVIHGHLF